MKVLHNCNILQLSLSHHDA